MSFRQTRFQIPEPVRDAYSDFKKVQKLNYHKHRNFAHRLRIDTAAFKEREKFLENIPTIFLRRLKTEYPPRRRDVCETEEIARIWNEYRANRKHPDPREARSMGGTWAETIVLNEAKLQRVIEVDESVIIRDMKTREIIGVVIRGACGDPGVLEWVTDIIHDNVGWRRNVRVRVSHQQSQLDIN